MNQQEKEMFNLFIEEATEQIEKIEEGILSLDQEFDIDVIKEVFRMFHSLKGSSASMGFERLAEITHDVETLLEKIKSQSIELNKDIIDLLFECLDKIKDMKNKIVETKKDDVDYTEQKEKIVKYVGKSRIRNENKNALEEIDVTEYELLVMDDAVKKGENVYIIKAEVMSTSIMKAMKAFLAINNLKGIGQVLRVWPENYDTISDDDFGGKFKLILITLRTKEIVEKNVDAAGDINNIIIEEFKGKDTENNSVIDVKINDRLQDNTLFRLEKRDYIRVNINKLDRLIGYIGELVIDGGRLIQTKDRLKSKYKGDPDIKELISISEHLDYIGTELQDSIMSVRVYTVENIFNRFQRMVRDLASRNDKDINFVTEGKNTELDRGILEEIVDPLVHLIRNSVDHGIETVDERKAKGKSPQGTISLKAKHQENNVLIEVEDDGRGINMEAVKNKALEKGLITVEQAGSMPDQDALNLIFIPGFSTAKVITDISGRGVGMDVVKTNIEKLNGIIDIESHKDKGSKFTIKLPLTLAIIQGLLIKEDNINFAVPLSSVIETVRLNSKEAKKCIKRVRGKEAYLWRDEIIPVVRINNYFQLETKTPEKVFLIIVGFYEKKICLITQKLMGEQQIVIKNLGEYLGRNKLLGPARGISGATVLGDGSVAYVVDIPDIVKDIKEHAE